MKHRQLNHLSLISNVCNALETHMGQTEKILAEFIVQLARRSETVDEFDKKLKEEGMELPDYLVRSLLTVIHAIYPPKRKSEKKRVNGEGGDKERFKGLAIKDAKDKVKELEKEIEREAEERRREDDRNRDRDRDHGRDHDRRESGRDLDRDRDRGDRRDRHRERTDGEDRRSDRHRERNRRDDENDDGRSDRRRDRRDMEEERGGANEPKLYQVYKGKVTKAMDKGCFVKFDQFRGKEGLVHVAEMATRRIENAKDFVKRDTEVYVKVVSISDGN